MNNKKAIRIIYKRVDVVKIIPPFSWPLKIFPQQVFQIWQMASRKTKGGRNTILGDQGDTCLIHIWRLTLLSVQRQRSRGTGVLKRMLRDTLQHTSSFVKRFVYLASMYHFVWMFQVKLRYCCYDWKYLLPDRVWNIHVETTENSISRFLDFNIFWGSNLPQETPRGWRLWRSQYFPLLRNIRISTSTPSQTPAKRLLLWLVHFVPHALLKRQGVV